MTTDQDHVIQLSLNTWAEAFWRGVHQAVAVFVGAPAGHHAAQGHEAAQRRSAVEELCRLAMSAAVPGEGYRLG
jgi:hypothetical protein